uniref:Uncharacterized protein n=1 Tax=Oryza glaberrima TaxID=4538 RepID=I1QSU8_ORYGL
MTVVTVGIVGNTLQPSLGANPHRPEEALHPTATRALVRPNLGLAQPAHASVSWDWYYIKVYPGTGTISQDVWIGGLFGEVPQSSKTLGFLLMVACGGQYDGDGCGGGISWSRRWRLPLVPSFSPSWRCLIHSSRHRYSYDRAADGVLEIHCSHGPCNGVETTPATATMTPAAAAATTPATAAITPAALVRTPVGAALPERLRICVCLRPCGRAADRVDLHLDFFLPCSAAALDAGGEGKARDIEARTLFGPHAIAPHRTPQQSTAGWRLVPHGTSTACYKSEDGRKTLITYIVIIVCNIIIS